jgi:HEAT repeat protein
MNFVNQIKLLTDIQVEKKTEALPELVELFRNPLNDTMVDHLVTTALNTLLTMNEKEVIRLLEEGSIQEKTLCVSIAGNCGFAGAVPVLHKMLENGCEGELLTDVLQTLSRIGAPESINIFRKYFFHENDMTATVAIEASGAFKDADAVGDLCTIIDRAGDDDQYDTCSLQAGMAVQSLAGIRTNEALSFLVSRIHHRNATLRRQIQDNLIKIGADAVPFIAPIFDGNDNDSKILAANILGFIKDRKGGDILVKALDTGKISHPNVKYAVYEAFGRIKSLKGVTCLVDALKETDDFILMAVVTALNEQVNQGIINAVKKALESDGEQSARIIKAIAVSKAVSIFRSLYEDEKYHP